ncbi:hypothetical protein EDB83DRAFT_2323081 [Lactarius deliciosus]|nr:hypothetical protein EDB83DRAFT_2323081 [Lactarius deliciosus]
MDKELVELVELVLDVDELDEDNTWLSQDRSQPTRHHTFHSSDETTSMTAPELSDVACCLRLCVKGKGSSRTGPITVAATVTKGERGWGQWGALHHSPCHCRQRHPGNVAGEVHCLRVTEKGEINTLDQVQRSGLSGLTTAFGALRQIDIRPDYSPQQDRNRDYRTRYDRCERDDSREQAKTAMDSSITISIKVPPKSKMSK